VAVSLNNLGELCHGQGRFAEAESLLIRSLTIRHEAYGPLHPSVATVLENLTRLFKETGRVENGEFLYRQACAIRDRAR
jgi:uncharacterized protein HemY